MTEEQVVRSALIDVQVNVLNDTPYAPHVEYGKSTNGGNPLRNGAVLLLFDANKELVGYSLIP